MNTCWEFFGLLLLQAVMSTTNLSDRGLGAGMVLKTPQCRADKEVGGHNTV